MTFESPLSDRYGIMVVISYECSNLNRFKIKLQTDKKKCKNRTKLNTIGCIDVVL